MQIIRWILGSLILTFDWLFTPKGIKRSREAQAAVNEQTKDLTLYHYKACPFCVKVRREMKRQSLNIETRDVKRSAAARDELLAGAKDLKVPCLRIDNSIDDVIWMVESGDIIGYLQDRFGSDTLVFTSEIKN
jgi:glutaredoxin